MTIFDEMVAAQNPQNPEEKINVQHEVMQQIALSGLQRGGFFGSNCHVVPSFITRIKAARSSPLRKNSS